MIQCFVCVPETFPVGLLHFKCALVTLLVKAYACAKYEVYDAGPTLIQHFFNVLCFLGITVISHNILKTNLGALTRSLVGNLFNNMTLYMEKDMANRGTFQRGDRP